MAAIICKTIGELCGSIGTILCLPCKALNLGCESCGQVLKSPFFPYIALTFALNIPGIIYALKSVDDNCPEFSKWLVVNGLFCGMHIAACMYIVKSIRSSPNDDHQPSTTMTSGNNNNNNNVEAGTYYQSDTNFTGSVYGAKNSCERIRHVLCYDKIMALYIIGFVAWLVWLSMGASRRLLRDPEGDECDVVLPFMDVVISCGYMYCSLVGVAFACSLCCLR